MATTTSELEAKLEREQAGYLKRLEDQGQLPSVISKAWEQAGGKEQKALRGQEAELLTKYGSAGAEARSKYKDIWDPSARGLLVAGDIESAYRPIATIRAELAMRAEALGIATQSAQAMYGAGTQRAETNLGFTQSAYERARAKEAEAQRQKERAEDIRIANTKKRTTPTTPTTPKGEKMTTQEMIKDAVGSNDPDTGRPFTWGKIAKVYEGLYGEIIEGSEADIYLKYYFGLREKNPGKYLSSSDLQELPGLGLGRG